jgi:hypothetical protein
MSSRAHLFGFVEVEDAREMEARNLLGMRPSLRR